MKTAVDLQNDSIHSLVLRLAIPAMIAQFVNILYSIIDRVYIGHIAGIGGLALAGVGVWPYRDAAVLLRHPGGSWRLHFDEYTDGREKPTESISDPGKFFLNAGCLLPRPHDYLSAEQGTAAHVVWRQ